MIKNVKRIVILSIAGTVALLGGCSGATEMEDSHSGPLMNYHRIDDRLVTGGHLLDGGSAILQQQGVTVVINLRDDYPPEEKKRFVKQGIEWINIPIEWKDPKQVDFDRFADTMLKHQDDHVLVQCAANYRAAAMTYLYRVAVDDVAEDEAKKDLNAVWNPDENDTWREFINATKTARR